MGVPDVVIAAFGSFDDIVVASAIVVIAGINVNMPNEVEAIVDELSDNEVISVGIVVVVLVGVVVVN